MFLRSKAVRGRLYWQVVEGYRDEGRVRQRVLFSLGSHATREAAQGEWEGIVARRESPTEYRRRRSGGIPCRGSA